MSSSKRSKEEAAGFGGVPGGPTARLAWRDDVVVVENTIPTSKKTKEKVLVAAHAGFAPLPGGPVSDTVTWDLSSAPTGPAPGGPDGGAGAEGGEDPVPTGECAGGPPVRDWRAMWRGAARRALAAKQVIEAAGPREGASPGGPPAPELVFGVRLEDLLEREGGRIPYVVAKALDYLSRDNYAACQLTGVFRLSGATSDVDALVAAFNWGKEDVNLDAITQDPIAVAALVKLYLRQLPEPLITYELNPVFLKLSASPTVDSVAQAILELPTANRDLLLQLAIFLNVVAQFADVNKMASPNLAIVVGPNLLRLPDMTPLQEIAMSGKISTITQFLIEYAYDLADATNTIDADRIYYDQLYGDEVQPAAADDGDDLDLPGLASLVSASTALANLPSDDDDDAVVDAPPPMPEKPLMPEKPEPPVSELSEPPVSEPHVSEPPVSEPDAATHSSTTSSSTIAAAAATTAVAATAATAAATTAVAATPPTTATPSTTPPPSQTTRPPPPPVEDPPLEATRAFVDAHKQAQ